jgi:hypothetical protein
MSRSLRIFRKDAQCLLPQALVCLTLMAIATLRDPMQPYGVKVGEVVSFVQTLSPFLAGLACWLLVVSLIQEERLIGDGQYWLTRPYSWKDLVAAKALFLVVFVHAPLLICQFAAVAQAGLSPWRWLPALLWRQVFFSLLLVMPAVALGAVTRHFGQVVVAAIAVFFVLEAVGGLLTGGPGRDWGGYDWIRTAGAALAMGAGLAAAILVQYTRRRTAVARAILGGVLALAFAIAIAPVGEEAFAIQKIFSREEVPDATARTSYDAQRAGTHPMQTSRSNDDPDGVHLEIPLRVDGVPPEEPVGADLTSVQIESAAGAWHSGWLAFRAFHGMAQGTAWLTVYVDPDFYKRSKDAPVRLTGALDFTLYRRVGTIAGPYFQVTTIPEAGVCAVLRRNAAECYSPFQRLTVDSAPAGGSYAPFPTSLGFQPFDCYSWSGSEAAPAAALVVPAAHMERRFEADGVRLQDFRVR